MNKEQLKGKWNQIKGEAKKQWGQLTDNDLTEVEGNYDKLVGKVQERHGDTEEKVKQWVDKLEHRADRAE